MKFKIIALFESVLIVVLVALLLNQFISVQATKPVEREPESPMESTLAYTPLSAPKIPLEVIQKLRELKKEFAPRITKVTDRIYNASGYALGNVQMVITDEGLVIIDATENGEAAGKILQEFRKITDKPVRYLIYTHGHLDHVFGTSSFLEAGTEVIATRDCVQRIQKSFGEMSDFYSRSRYIQAGKYAEPYASKQIFKSPVRLPAALLEADVVLPTITFDTEYSFTLGDKVFELYHTNGETEDHLMIWMPQEKALFPGDLYYFSFPNLSAPMLPPRPVRGWYESIDQMIALGPEYLVPGHSQPVVGREKVREMLATHSQAIRFVYEKTIQMINAGKSVEEAIMKIRLPERLAVKKQLREVYGRVDWSVRGIYQAETGWYDGSGSGLDPLPERFRARELIQLSGGADKVLQRAIDLQKAGEHQLTCELCDVVIAANPADKLARIVKASSLDHLAMLCGNLNMFGFYRSAASMERKAAGVTP